MFAIRLVRVFSMILILGLSGQAFAGGHIQQAGPGEGPKQMRAMTKMAERLNLTDNQKQDFAALMELYRPRLEEIMKRGKVDREALISMAPDSPDYPATSDRVSREAARSAGETVTLLAELQGLVYSLLTPEQQVRFMDIRDERREKMREMRDKHKGMRGKGKHGSHACKHEDHEAGYCPHHDGDKHAPTDGS